RKYKTNQYDNEKQVTKELSPTRKQPSTCKTAPAAEQRRVPFPPTAERKAAAAVSIPNRKKHKTPFIAEEDPRHIFVIRVPSERNGVRTKPVKDRRTTRIREHERTRTTKKVPSSNENRDPSASRSVTLLTLSSAENPRHKEQKRKNGEKAATRA
ncbi:unnamed protein product, partial [Ectocarpus sp. 6 AP-2014]